MQATPMWPHSNNLAGGIKPRAIPPRGSKRSIRTSREPPVGESSQQPGSCIEPRQVREAEGLYKRALAIREKALGANHPDVGQTLNNLALVYRAQGKYSEAEGLYKRALAIREKALGANHPDVGQTLNNLASVYRDQGKYAEAEGLFKRALAIREQALGPSHPDVAATRHDLAAVASGQGRTEEEEAKPMA